MTETFILDVVSFKILGLKQNIIDRHTDGQTDVKKVQPSPNFDQVYVNFCLFCFFLFQTTFFSHVGTSLPGLNSTN